ncbi:MAG: ABC transporter ATP-binding protein [Tissierellaceae bacterium]|nr:ABC transporter ATP-binding protein [Tissierellaceae bacterium]
MLKRFFIYFRKYRYHLIGSMVCVMLESAFELVIPLIMSDIIDVGVANRDKNYILGKGLAMIVCALISLLLGVMYARLAAKAGQGFGAELRKAEYQKIQSFSFSNMDHFSTPSLITRLTSDITIMQNAICNGIRPVVRSPVMLVLALVMTILMNPQLAMIFGIAMPILAVCLILILKKLGPIYRKMQRTLDRVNSIVQENLTAIRTVKSYVKGEYECGKFSKVNKEFKESSEEAFHYAVMNMPCFLFVMYSTIIAILWFGGNFINSGTMQVGKLTGFLSYVLQILNSLMMISNVFLMLSRSMTSADRILEVMDEPLGIIGGPSDYIIKEGTIDFEHVYFKYQETAREYVLSDICLHIEKGQTVGIIGGTGSAKSTLVQLIPRLYDVTSGIIKIDGRNIKEYSLPHLRDAVGMVLQKNTLFSGTIRENLKWGNENATDEELDLVCRIACVDEFLEKMPEKYDTNLGQGGVNISGGQKQRLCIARALLKKPKILILDDSTSAVDTATEAKIYRGMAENLKDTTKIVITQRVSSIKNADFIIVLKDGKINDMGTHEELLFRNIIYRDIYKFQEKEASA